MDTARPTSRHVVVSGGGSGGHVFPGLAVAHVLGDRGWSVSWIGRAASLEERLVEAAGLPFDAVAARPVAGRGPVAAAGALMTTAWAAGKARRVLRDRGAAAVLGMGGFVSAPGVLAAAVSGRPVVLVEPNADAGVANRWLSRWSRMAALAAETSATGLKCGSEVTGVPVRAAFHEVPAVECEGAGSSVLVLGGSQGARPLNRILAPALTTLARRRPGLRVVHQVGERWVDETRALYDEAGHDGSGLEVVPFIDDVAVAMAAAHLIVSRAGAIALAEICAAGRPAVLVPLAIAGGHQERNARRLEEAGAARVLSGDAGVDEAAGLVESLLGDGAALTAAGRAARALAEPLAADRIADLVEEAAS